ncbi:MAG: dTDP-4-dehydrorhamnose 3,5-epimerase family protein [Candidatus Berkelbacteria bacterium]|nr:dTDP-4-dehydrorhamnose 3,5-epimerase family protein [Candidatus Berkelbacteria bacterium]
MPKEKSNNEELPQLIEGGIAIDDRGEVVFANGFDFKGVKRFYMVSNHKAGMVRAWHAHKKEAKYVLVTSGAAVVGAVKIDNWENPSKWVEVRRHVLSAKKPSLLYIPAGYANGFMSLTEDTKIVFFSTSTLEESKGDDIRYDSRYWDIWEVVER